MMASVPLEDLGRLTECPQEGAAHPLPVGEAGLPGHRIERMPAILQHGPGGVQAKVLDGLRGRLAGLLAEDAAELARAQMGCFPSSSTESSFFRWPLA